MYWLRAYDGLALAIFALSAASTSSIAAPTADDDPYHFVHNYLRSSQYRFRRALEI